jgi:hypothetical protein
MEDIPKGELVLVGTFALNGQIVVILFNSCATHDFISRACRKKQLDIQQSDTPTRLVLLEGRWQPNTLLGKPLSN